MVASAFHNHASHSVYFLLQRIAVLSQSLVVMVSFLDQWINVLIIFKLVVNLLSHIFKANFEIGVTFFSSSSFSDNFSDQSHVLVNLCVKVLSRLAELGWNSKHFFHFVFVNCSWLLLKVVHESPVLPRSQFWGFWVSVPLLSALVRRLCQISLPSIFLWSYLVRKCLVQELGNRLSCFSKSRFVTNSSGCEPCKTSLRRETISRHSSNIAFKLC